MDRSEYYVLLCTALTACDKGSLMSSWLGHKIENFLRKLGVVNGFQIKALCGSLHKPAWWMLIEGKRLKSNGVSSSIDLSVDLYEFYFTETIFYNCEKYRDES